MGWGEARPAVARATPLGGVSRDSAGLLPAAAARSAEQATPSIPTRDVLHKHQTAPRVGLLLPVPLHAAAWCFRTLHRRSTLCVGLPGRSWCSLVRAACSAHSSTVWLRQQEQSLRASCTLTPVPPLQLCTCRETHSTAPWTSTTSLGRSLGTAAPSGEAGPCRAPTSRRAYRESRAPCACQPQAACTTARPAPSLSTGAS